MIRDIFSVFFIQCSAACHTFRRIVAEETGSTTATQYALDHTNLSTMTVCVQRVAVRRDLHSAAVARRRKGRDEV